MRRLVLLASLALACTTGPVPPTSSPQPTAQTHLPTPTPAPTEAPTTTNEPAATAPPTGSPTATATSTPAPTPRPTPRVAFGDGIHVVGDIVGDGIQPGTYRTIAYNRTDCYWTRLSGFESGLADWISSGIGDGYQVVTIGPFDAGFDSQNCGDWTDDLSRVTESTVEFAEGTYLVGVDIEPGTYVAQGTESCYWARLAGFGGLDEERIEEALLSAGDPATVTILETDAGFTSDGCAMWTLGGT